MSLPITNIINVSISLQTKGVTQTGFGVPLIVGDNATGWSERSRSYSTIDGVGDDFETTDEEYIAANAIFSQNPNLPLIRIGVQDTLVAQIQTIVFSAALITGNSVAMSVDGVALTATPFNTSNAQTLTDLAAKIQAEPGVATAVSNGTDTITVTSQTAGVPTLLSTPIVTGGASQATAEVDTTTANHGIAEDLSEIREENDDWYCLIFTNRTQGHVEQAAAYIETQRKIFITASDDADILDGTVDTDIASVLKANNYLRTAVIYSADVASFPDAAWAGARLIYEPGQATWKFATLVGIEADNLTQAQFDVVVASLTGDTKNGNVYVPIAGKDITAEGTMGGGDFIDTPISADWIQARAEERIYNLLTTLPKVPFTDGGITSVVNELNAVLQNAEKNGILAPDPKFSITAPKAVDVDPNDRAHRHLTGITFRGRLAGAIHRVNLVGTLTV